MISYLIIRRCISSDKRPGPGRHRGITIGLAPQKMLGNLTEALLGGG